MFELELRKVSMQIHLDVFTKNLYFISLVQMICWSVMIF